MDYKYLFLTILTLIHNYKVLIIINEQFFQINMYKINLIKMYHLNFK